MSGKLPKNPSAFVSFLEELIIAIEKEEKRKGEEENGNHRS